jgi:hypothetical protein
MHLRSLILANIHTLLQEKFTENACLMPGAAQECAQKLRKTLSASLKGIEDHWGNSPRLLNTLGAALKM